MPLSRIVVRPAVVGGLLTDRGLLGQAWRTHISLGLSSESLGSHLEREKFDRLFHTHPLVESVSMSGRYDTYKKFSVVASVVGFGNLILMVSKDGEYVLGILEPDGEHYFLQYMATVRDYTGSNEENLRALYALWEHL